MEQHDDRQANELMTLLAERVTDLRLAVGEALTELGSARPGSLRRAVEILQRVTDTPELSRWQSQDNGLSTAQAAQQLGVTVGTVRTWARRGQVASWLNQRGDRRYDQTEVLALAERLRTSVGRSLLVDERPIYGTQAHVSDGLSTGVRSPDGL